MTSAEDLVLLPAPRALTPRPGTFELAAGLPVTFNGNPVALFPIASRVQSALWETQAMRWPLRAGQGNARERGVTIDLVSGKAIGPQAYRLEISPEGVTISAGDPAGAYYGAMTLRQLLRQSRGALPSCVVEDEPDFPVRGVMLDISRDKVPTLETLLGLVDRLSEWKVNHFELYTEHTFAYRNHPEVWAQASPVTGENILVLDAYCRERFIELVPNQNSFGHMHRWLQLPRYRHLAECPEGSPAPWKDDGRLPPYSLDPTNPQSFALIEELYAELLPHFTSTKLNVGCDETFDLGLGKSKAECDRKGKGRVYLEFLLKVHDVVTRHGHTMHFWGDIIGQHPELVPEVPKDAVVLEWGYEGDHPFDEHGARLADSEVPFYVCPGTSSWNSIAGRTDNCLANLRNAAVNGTAHGARGFLNTDWGDNGHWQHLPVSYLGFAAGAALSWCDKSNRDIDITAALDLHAFRDAAGVAGKVAFDLGNAYRREGHGPPNRSALWLILATPAERGVPAGVTEDSLRAAADHIQAAAEPLERARMAGQEGELVRAELENASHMLLHACRRGRAIIQGELSSAQRRAELASDMHTILGNYRSLWSARNRPGGLQDSTSALEARLNEYDGN